MNSADNRSTIPFEDFGGTGSNLHFAHANGYPPGAYEPLLSNLANDFHTIAMHMRALWPNSNPDEIMDWRPLSDDLAIFLDQQNFETVIGAGHSMGATTTLRLALLEPERFSKLILIDPVLFPPKMILTWKVYSKLGIGERYLPIINNTKRRRDEFDSIHEIFAIYRRKHVFRYFDNQALSAYVNAITLPTDEGIFTLRYPKLWEARIYQIAIHPDMDIWRNLSSIKQPILVIRGSETDTFWESTAERFIRKVPKTEILTIPESTHLVPMERPGTVSEAILSFLKQ